MSKRLFTSIVVGAGLVLSTVLVVSMIGGDDKPEVNTEKPPADEQPPEDDQAADDTSDQDTSDDTSDSDETSGDDTPDSQDDDEGSDDLPDDTEDDLPDKGEGKGEKKGQLQRHREANSGMDQQNCEKNELEHAAEDMADEDGEPEESGLRAGECNCGDGGIGKCQSGE